MTTVVDEFEARVIGGGLAPPTGDAALELAEAVKRLAVGDVPRALRVSEAMLGAWRDEGLVRVHWLSARAHVLCYANRFEEALTALGIAAELARRLGDQPALGQVSLTSVQALARLGRLEEADRAAETARGAFAAGGDPLGEGKACLNHGIVLRMRGRLDAALSAFERAGALVGEDVFLRGALSSNRAEVLLDLDRFADAEGAFATAAALMRASGNGHAAAIIEGNLADLLSREGRLDAALEGFERARRSFEASGADADVARLRAEEAEALAALGATDDAARAYAVAIQRLEAAGLQRELARARLGMGLVLLRLGADADAAGLLEAALGELLALDADALAGVCTIALAVLAIRGGRAAEGMSLAERGAARLAAFPVRLAHARAELADALLTRGDAEGARAQLDLLDAAPAERELLPLRSRVAHVRGRLALASGRRSEGLASLLGAMRDAERLRGSIRVESLRLAFGESWRRVYLDVCRAALDAGDAQGVATAFDALERIRSRTVLEALGSGGAGRQADSSGEGGECEGQSGLRGEYQRCLHELNVLYSRTGLHAGVRGPGSPPDARRLMDLEQRLGELAQRLGAVGDEAGGGVGGAGRLGREPMPLDEALASVPERAVVLLLFPDGEHLGALALERGGATVLRGLASRREIEATLRRLRFAVSAADSTRVDGPDGASGVWAALTSRLARQVLEPVEPLLEHAEHIAISAFGELEAIPWAVLPWRGSLLGSERCVTSTPGVTIARELAAGQRAEPGGHLLAVGVPDELAPAMEAEASAVALAGGGAALVGPAATAEAVLAAARSASTLHLAAHCVYSSINPMSSRVKLSDRWVTARELAGAVRRGATVVLAGCESGRSGGVAEDDRQGLIRALLASGAARVIAAHWPLHDATAGAMMPRLHAALAASTDSPAWALRAARTEMDSLGIFPWLHGAVFMTGALT